MIKLFLNGGAVAPYVGYLPVTVTGGTESAGATAKKADSSGSSDLTDKDMLKMLEKLDGLPNDMAALSQHLQNFYIDSQFTSDGTVNTSNIATRYLSALNQMKTLNFYKKSYDEAFDIVKSNGGLNELAIAGDSLIAMNKDFDIKYIKPSEMQDLPEGYLLLSNSQLLALRANNPQLVGNTNVIDLVKNGIGMETVTKMIKDSMMSLGTNESKMEGYARTDKDKLISGLQDFQKAQEASGLYDATTDNLYKGSYLTKSLAEAANKALTYIYRTLPTNAKTLLKTKTNGGTDKEAAELIGTLINSNVSETTQFSVDMDSASAAKVEAKRKETGVSDKDKLHQSLATDVLAGFGGHDTMYTLDNATGVGLTVPGTYYELLKSADDKPIGRISMAGMLGETGLRAIMNGDNGVFFGDQKIDLNELKNITYDGNGLLRTNLPIRSDGSPNFDLMEDWSKMLQDIEMGMNPKLALLKYPNLRELTDALGNFRKDKFAPFMVASGMTTNGLVKLDKENKFITEKEPDANLILDIKLSLKEGSGKDAIMPDIDEYDWSEWLMPSFINDYDHIFKGNIYIPINPNKRAAAYGSNQNIPISEANDLEEEYQQRDLTYNTGSASLLNN